MVGDDEHPLRDLRDEVAPGADPAFRDRLDAHLRVAHAQQAPRPPLWSRLPRVAVAVPALAVVLLVATVAMVARDESAVAAIELRDAINVVVTLPSGVEITDPADGFRLTDGAVVTVGEGGAVTIDDVTLSAGTVVTVRDGSLVTDVIGTSTTRPVPTRPSTVTPVTPPQADTAPTSTAPPDSRPVDVTTTISPVPPPDTPRQTLPPEREPPGETDPPDPPRPDPPPPDDNDQTDDSGDKVTPVSLALRVYSEGGADGGRVRVVWRVEGIAADQSHEVVVVRTTDGSDPNWPVGTGEVVGSGPHGEVTEVRSALGDGIVKLRYRVIVVDEAGGIVARSAVQTLSDR